MDTSTKDLVLYYHEHSPFSDRVRIVLREKKLDFEEVFIKVEEDVPRWYLSLNPKGQVPTLKHNNKVIYESSIICEYLEEAFPEKKLLPDDPYLRAKARLFTYFIDRTYYPAFVELFENKDPNLNETKANQLIDAVEKIDKFLREGSEAGPFIFGAQFSLADISFIPWMMRWCWISHFKNINIPEQLVRLRQWYEACISRDSVKQIRLPDTEYISFFDSYRKKKEEQERKSRNP